MLKLDPEDHDEAVRIMAEALSVAKQMELRTNTAQASIVLAVLAEDFDISRPDPGPRTDLPLACDEIDQYISDVWPKNDFEAKNANAIMDWITGVWP